MLSVSFINEIFFGADELEIHQKIISHRKQIKKIRKVLMTFIQIIKNMDSKLITIQIDVFLLFICLNDDNTWNGEHDKWLKHSIDLN